MLSLTNTLGVILMAASVSLARVTPRTLQQEAIGGVRSALFSGIMGLTVVSAIPAESEAAKGAFEMDAEYYISNIFSKNKGEAAKTGDGRRPIYKTPRKLDTDSANQIYSKLIDLVRANSAGKGEELEEKVAALRQSKLGYFKSFAPIVTETLTDQYFFDISLWAMYQIAQGVIPTSEKRVKFRTQVGEAVYSSIRPIRKSTPTVPIAFPAPIKEAIDDVVATLQGLKRAKLIASYSFDSEDASDEQFARETFAVKAPISFQITIDEPATLLSFLEGQIEDTFFHPEIIGSCLAASLRSNGYWSKYEDYLLDNYYRESNFDLRADAVILEFSIIPERVAPASYAAFNT